MIVIENMYSKNLQKKHNFTPDGKNKKFYFIMSKLKMKLLFRSSDPDPFFLNSRIRIRVKRNPELNTKQLIFPYMHKNVHIEDHWRLVSL